MKKSRIKIGDKFGKLTVVRETGTFTKHRNRIFATKCDCGHKKEYLVPADWLLRGSVVKCKFCRSKKVGDIPYHWFSKAVLGRVRKYGYTKNWIVNIDIEYAWNLFLEQKGKCALSGIPLYFPKVEKLHGTDGNISMDRINSKKGYIKGNVQWVYKNVNIMKNNFTQEEFIKICKLIAKYNK